MSIEIFGEISLMAKSDVHRVLEIQKECNLSVWSAADYFAEICNADSLMLVERLDQTTNGFLAARLTKALPLEEQRIIYADADILNFGVAEAFQKRGIGTRLLEYFFSIIKPLNLEAVWLEVRESNAKAINFYEKSGFVQIQIRRNFYRDPTENAVLMKLDFWNSERKT
jgi:ribosomal-protein-alanine N-acetyltransferase